MDNAEKIKLIGIACFGSRWQTEMSRYIGVNSRTVRHWMEGKFKPSDHYVNRAKHLLGNKLMEIKHTTWLISESNVKDNT